jgi:uroporphyrin-III C-methyltransferase
MTQGDFAPGTVWLVGAGPGEPELLTRKAERLVGQADVIFHDALVGPGVLALARLGAELVSVGKRSGRQSKSQEAINILLLKAACEGRRVVRLKGGDPSIFGRSAEKIDCLAAAGVRVQVCPGITAASAAAGSAGISLALRGLTFVTAHARAGEAIAIDWPAP